MASLISTLIALCYLAFMFIMTHLPKQRVPKTLGMAGDKTLHTLAFFGLGLLASLALRLRLKNYGRYAYALFTLVLGLLYAWFDELTQPLVGRHYDLKDILADGIGLIGGIIVFEIALQLTHKLTRTKEMR